MNAYLILDLNSGIESRISDMAEAMRLWTVIRHGTMSFYDAASNKTTLWGTK